MKQNPKKKYKSETRKQGTEKQRKREQGEGTKRRCPGRRISDTGHRRCRKRVTKKPLSQWQRLLRRNKTRRAAQERASKPSSCKCQVRSFLPATSLPSPVTDTQPWSLKSNLAFVSSVMVFFRGDSLVNGRKFYIRNPHWPSGTVLWNSGQIIT